MSVSNANAKKMLESLSRRLEKERQERLVLFTKLRKDLDEMGGLFSEFNIGQVILFGSITNKEKFTERSDIDIGIIGIDKKDFFRFYSRLTESIDWPIDLVDLEEDKKFKDMILEKGESIYDRTSNHHKNLNL